MARIYLACVASTLRSPFARRDYERLQNYYQTDVAKKHVCIDDPEDADLIVFVGSSLPNYADVRGSALYQRYRGKSVIVDSSDRPIPVIPGVYTCLERRWFARRRRVGARSGCYLRVAENTSLDIDDAIQDARYLFSFVGNAENHSCRAAICRLNAARSFVYDTSSERLQVDGVNGNNRARGERYRQSIAQSKFVLCPRGIGVSSWRIFETMRAGRVPVIISDQWIPGDGPVWRQFAIFIPECKICDIPRILEARESEAEQMGRAARGAWEQYYSSKNAFTTVVDLALEAHREWCNASRIARSVSYLQYLEPHFFRHWLLGVLVRKIKSPQ